MASSPIIINASGSARNDLLKAISSSEYKNWEKVVKNGTYLEVLKENPEALPHILRGILELRWLEIKGGQKAIKDLVNEGGLNLSKPAYPGRIDNRSPAEIALIAPWFLETMIELGLDVNARLPDSQYGGTLLHTAIQILGQMKDKAVTDFVCTSMMMLVEAGADGNILCTRGSPPLEYALQLCNLQGLDVKVVKILLPATTCMSMYKDVDPAGLSALLAKPVNASYKKLLPLSQDPAQVRSEKARMLLCACEYRLPDTNSMLMLLGPLCDVDSYAGWWQKAGQWLSLRSGSSMGDGGRAFTHGCLDNLSPTLVKKFKEQLLKNPKQLGLYAILHASKSLRQAVMTDRECVAQLHWGARSLSEKIRTEYGGKLPDELGDLAIVVMRIVSNVMTEATPSAIPGTSPFVASFANENHWQDILNIRCAEGGASLELAEVPALMESIVYCGVGGGRRMVERVTAFAEALTGCNSAYLDVWAREAKAVLKDAIAGRSINIRQLQTLRSMTQLMIAMHAIQKMDPTMKRTLQADLGVPLSEMKALEARMAACMSTLRSSKLWEFLQQLIDIQGLPKGVRAAQSYVKTDWQDLTFNLNRLFGKDTSPIFGTPKEVMAKTSAPIGGKEVEDLVREADAKINAKRVNKMYGQGCSYCNRVPAEVEGISQGGSSGQRVASSLLKCGRCHKARYCGAECQKAHWKAGHKQQCKQWCEEAAEVEV